ncbi:MAG: hypothetical protein KBD56_01995 [Candidatus Eisenbacteria bacterium]|nr:hypothetical protein [Candidatus Eisenbacteria bacterium]
MYKINLYPEREERLRAARRRVAMTAGLTGLLAIETIFAGALLASGLLLGERVGALRASARESAQAVQNAGGSPGMERALQLLRIRSARTLWSPKLSALSECTGPDLHLEEIHAQKGAGEQPDRFEVSGTLSSGSSEVESVSRFLDRLRDEPRIGGSFSRITLATIEADDRFHVICTTEGGGQ